jgi:hypothetical protein
MSILRVLEKKIHGPRSNRLLAKKREVSCIKWCHNFGNQFFISNIHAYIFKSYIHDLAVNGKVKKEGREQTNRTIEKSIKEHNRKIRKASDPNYLPDMDYYFETIYTSCVIQSFTCTNPL